MNINATLQQTNPEASLSSEAKTAKVDQNNPTAMVQGGERTGSQTRITEESEPRLLETGEPRLLG